MDFSQRGQTVNANSGEHVSAAGGKKKRNGRGGILRYITATLLVLVTVLVVLIIIVIATSAPKRESKFINDGQLQAVFLNNGQVYFGDIKTLNDKYIQLQNIYYLRVNQTVQPKSSTQSSSNDVSLVKLGCELHGPGDEMLINRDQVTFWENLKSDGQVAKAVASYVKANPNGQNCSTNNSTSTGQ